MEHTQLCRLSHCLERIPEVPRWCLALAGERIVAGLGMIENDFHPRTDLAPMSVPSTPSRTAGAGGLPGSCSAWPVPSWQPRG